MGGPFGLTRSTDEGQSWELTQFPGCHERNEAAHCRAVMVKADDRSTIFVGTGDTVPGETGGCASHVTGVLPGTWPICLSRPTRWSTWMANHPARPEVVACATLFGQHFWSTDGGHTWEQCRRSFGEILALALTPAA